MESCGFLGHFGADGKDVQRASSVLHVAKKTDQGWTTTHPDRIPQSLTIQDTSSILSSNVWIDRVV